MSLGNAAAFGSALEGHGRDHLELAGTLGDFVSGHRFIGEVGHNGAGLESRERIGVGVELLEGDLGLAFGRAVGVQTVCCVVPGSRSGDMVSLDGALLGGNSLAAKVVDAVDVVRIVLKNHE